MTGLYGLELRAVTAALNASVLPIAVRTEEHVERGVAAAGIHAPVMVMRGDGGATDPAGLRREPARALYSGPAASVAGVLRHTRLVEGIVIEVGGTSTNVAAMRDGRPALSYVQVASHATAVRALDVRVIGVAGGSMVRARKGRLYGVGPRSAHIAGLPYSCYLPAERARGGGGRARRAAARTTPPTTSRSAWPTAVGAALTNTCAAIVLGVVQPGDHAASGADRGRRRGRRSRPPAGCSASTATSWPTGAAHRPPRRSAAWRWRVADEFELSRPDDRGGRWGSGRPRSPRGRTCSASTCIVPDLAEVISAVGDALSLVRVERERTVAAGQTVDVVGLAEVVEAACVEAGAEPGSRRRAGRARPRRHRRAGRRHRHRSARRPSALPGRQPISEAEAAAAGQPVREPSRHARSAATGSPRVTGDRGGALASAVVLDRFGDVVAAGLGGVRSAAADDAPSPTSSTWRTRRKGPVTIEPTAWVVQGNRAAPGAADAARRRLPRSRSRAGPGGGRGPPGLTTATPHTEEPPWPSTSPRAPAAAASCSSSPPASSSGCCSASWWAAATAEGSTTRWSRRAGPGRGRGRPRSSGSRSSTSRPSPAAGASRSATITEADRPRPATSSTRRGTRPPGSGPAPGGPVDAASTTSTCAVDGPRGAAGEFEAAVDAAVEADRAPPSGSPSAQQQLTRTVRFATGGNLGSRCC